MGPGAGRHQGRAQAAGTRGRRGLGGCPDGERGHGASHPSPVPSTGGTAACGWHRALHREWVLTTEHEGLRVPRPHVGQAGRSRAGAVAMLPSPGTATAGPACQIWHRGAAGDAAGSQPRGSGCAAPSLCPTAVPVPSRHSPHSPVSLNSFYSPPVLPARRSEPLHVESLPELLQLPLVLLVLVLEEPVQGGPADLRGVGASGEPRSCCRGSRALRCRSQEHPGDEGHVPRAGHRAQTERSSPWFAPWRPGAALPPGSTAAPRGPWPRPAPGAGGAPQPPSPSCGDRG